MNYPGLVPCAIKTRVDTVTKLVIELQTHLQLSRRVPLARDLPESRVVNGRVRRVEHDIVEEIEGLRAELKVSLFSNPEVELAEDGHINIVPMLTDPWVHFLIAICVRRWLSEGAGIEPFLLGVDTRSTVGIPYHVDALLVAATNIFRIAIGGNRVGLPRGDLYDAVERPSSS